MRTALHRGTTVRQVVFWAIGPTLLVITCLGSADAPPSTARAAGPAGFDATVLPFMKTHCLRCHDAKQQKGEFRLDTLSRDFGDQAVAQRWGEVLVRMNSGEMPPKKEPRPKAEELGKVVEWISTRIQEGEAARMAKRGPVAHYRLSREEYGRTVYDLLGVHFDVNAPGAFNEDPRWHGFDRIGSLLSLSPSHVDRYFKAAETVLGHAFPEQPPTAQKGRREANAGQEKWLEQQGLKGPARWLLWPGKGQQLFHAAAPGLYRIRIRLSGVPSFKGRLPHLALWHHGLKRSVAGRDVSVPEDEPTTIEIETFLPEGGFDLINESPGMLSDGHTFSNTEFTFVNSRVTRPTRPTAYKLFDDEGKPIFPMLMVDWVEWEGPILTESDRKKRDGLFPTKAGDKAGDLAEARVCLKRFADRAWRRPATDTEIDRYVKIVKGELAAGENLRSAYRTAMVGVLTSKNFYYLEEGSPDKRRDKVNDWELASRLSYFLWNSMPDDALFAAAKSGKLHEPAALKAQFARMLGDAKVACFTESFPRQWLQLHRVGMFPPDPGLFPDYDKWLERSMVLETTQFFDAVFRDNLSLREFLASDWTMVNPRLAMHYGLPALKGTGFQKVKLRPEDHRGGLLTQASILSLTSDGTRHRPVHRGVWVSEAIFGRTPPPPPPNVEPLEPTPGNKPKATIRQQLEAHATHATCASCHQKIDPLGFAFENFDAIGRWRTEERVPTGQGANPPVNASGKLPDGRPFRGPDEFGRLLVQDIDRFAEAFVEQLATYALRRVMTIDDAAQIRAIAAASKKDGYKLRTVVENLITSDLFQKR
jgi:mono/diheme cytochrome c family protein